MPKGQRKPDPSPREIKERKEAICNDWDEKTRNRRLVQKPIPWVVPVVSVQELGIEDDVELGEI